MHNARVLITDDEVELCNALKVILEEQWDNYLISVAYSGDEAVSILKKQSFDVLVTDIRMPGMNGIELMKKAMLMQKHIQTIIITGHGDMDTAVEALRLGAHNFLTKPVYSEVLHFAVKNAWEKKKEISERLQTEKALQESEKRYRTLFNNASDAIFVHDFQNRFTDVNRIACERLGYSCEELLKMKSEDIVAPHFLESLEKKLESIQKKGHIVFEYEHIRRDGTTIPIEASSRFIEHEGKPAIFTIARDISERKEAEIKQAELQSQIHQAQKMESVGTLAGGIAHDFNNILFPIIGYTEMALDETSNNLTVASYLEEILRASHRAKDLVSQILTFSRQKDHEKMPMKIQYIIKEALKLMRATLPTTIEIRQTIHNCGTILADAGQMHQVIINLCTNAYHAMIEKGGILEIKLKEAELSSYILNTILNTHPNFNSGKYVKLSITDTGHGINPEIMERIFDPYFTTKEQGKGTGLGLSVVHGIIQKHEGCISVSSIPDQGTTFDIYLPLIKNNEQMPEKKNNHIILKGSETILLVDDEPQIADMLKQMLERLGYNVISRTSSLEALEAFRNQPAKFDLMITDATMPNMTGIELAQKILNIKKDIPIILCTGFSEIITKQKAKAAGISEYVMKPVLKEDIARTIRKLLD